MTLFEKTPRPILSPMPELDWASGAVFNPGAWYDGERVHLLFRAVPGGYGRIKLESNLPTEPETGFDERYISYIGYASSADGVNFEARPEAFIRPDAPFDQWGAEDPRISCIDGEYLITYTALSHPAFGTADGVRIGLASTRDFQSLCDLAVGTIVEIKGQQGRPKLFRQLADCLLQQLAVEFHRIRQVLWNALNV